ncbi:MAG: hypothetical protein OXI08_09360 [Cyanobacteria bacterium MAG IRC4_bin_6]|nr:hypothetical protein [Cyanobacteria bacterium MAG IRC3_bin_20]MDE0648220.1 hypothetical protein [Cyanobacteria bacterium MAG IRC4_bin_6]
MKIRRDVASIPARSAKETWQAIVSLVIGSDTVDREQLDAASSIIESLLVDELASEIPIVFSGVGPRLVIYCLYGSKAVEASFDIDPLSFNPTAGDWQATAPCEPEDVQWMNASLKAQAPRISVHEADQAPTDGEKTIPAATFQVDWEALKRP